MSPMIKIINMTLVTNMELKIRYTLFGTLIKSDKTKMKNKKLINVMLLKYSPGPYIIPEIVTHRNSVKINIIGFLKIITDSIIFELLNNKIFDERYARKPIFETK